MSKSVCKVATFNLLHDLPAYRQIDRRLEMIAAAIARERPHVAALQEVARAKACGDVSARLRALVNARCGAQLYELDYTVADGAGDGEWAFEDGIALLSRLKRRGALEIFKFDSQVRISTEFAGHRYRLPDDRVAMRARYRLSDGLELEACVTHLTDSDDALDGVAVRARQARELVRWLNERCDPSRPLIVGGDFNDLPESETIAAFTAAGFIDLWRAAGAGPGYTNVRDEFDPESAAGAPSQRIDYLFIRPGSAARHEIADARLFLDRPQRNGDGSWLWASDHAGVIATVCF